MLKICELWHSNGYIRFYFFNVFDLLFIFFLYAEKCTERSFITCTSVLKGSNNQGIFLKYNKSKYSFFVFWCLYEEEVEVHISNHIYRSGHIANNTNKLSTCLNLWHDVFNASYYWCPIRYNFPLEMPLTASCQIIECARNVLIVFIGKCQCFENV